MEKKNLKSKIISGVLIGSVVMSMGITAFAFEFNGEESITEDATKSMANTMGKFKFKGEMDFKHGHRKGGEDLNETLKVLVEEGKVTQDTVDAINKFLEAKMEERKVEFEKIRNMTKEERKAYFEENKKEKTDLMSELVESGIVTEEQANEIKENMPKNEGFKKGDFRKGPERKGGEDLNETLKVLVEEGKVTQDTADAMNKFIESKMEERKEMVRDFKNKKPEPRRDILVEMKEEGIITDEVIDAIRAKKEEMKEEHQNEMVSGLVEKGIITEEDKLEILDFMKAKMEERKAEFEKIRNMTEEERKAYFEENKKEKTNLMSELVEEGIITEEQANEIKENMPKHEGFNKGNHRKGPEGKGHFGPNGFNKNKENY